MTEGNGVDEFEAGTGSDAGGKAGDLHAESGKFLGQIESGGFAAGIGSETEDDFGHLVLLGPLEESGKFQLFGTDSVQRGKKSAKDMILAFKGAGAFEIQDIGRVFDHAEKSGISVFIAANFTEAVFRKKTAFRAGLNLGPCLFHGMGEIFGCPGGGGE